MARPRLEMIAGLLLLPAMLFLMRTAPKSLSIRMAPLLTKVPVVLLTPARSEPPRQGVARRLAWTDPDSEKLALPAALPPTRSPALAIIPASLWEKIGPLELPATRSPSRRPSRPPPRRRRPAFLRPHTAGVPPATSPGGDGRAGERSASDMGQGGRGRPTGRPSRQRYRAEEAHFEGHAGTDPKRWRAGPSTLVDNRLSGMTARHGGPGPAGPDGALNLGFGGLVPRSGLNSKPRPEWGESAAGRGWSWHPPPNGKRLEEE